MSVRTSAEPGPVLICVGSEPDPCVPPVRAALEARGAGVLLLATDGFPTDVKLSLELGGGVCTWSGALAGIRPRAVWIRDLEAAARLPDEMRADWRQAAACESDSALAGMLGCLDDVFTLDPLRTLRSAPHKPRQLRLAERAGLTIPRSLISNDPEAVRAFATRCPQGVIAKLVASGALGVVGDKGVEPVYTRVLGPEDFAALDSLCYSPMLFQERVPKDLELRVTAVGRELFCAAVQGDDSEVDWRASGALVDSFRPFPELPEALSDAISRLLDGLGLNFATLDLIRTPDGRWVFLELNTISYFDFVERAAGLPISEAVAELLMGLRPRRC